MEYELEQDEQLSMAVVRAVSAVEGRDPLDLPILAAVLDPDALDGLFTTNTRGESRTGGSLTFIYSESRVTIEHGEYLSIQPLPDLGAFSRRRTDYLTN